MPVVGMTNKFPMNEAKDNFPKYKRVNGSVPTCAANVVPKNKRKYFANRFTLSLLILLLTLGAITIKDNIAEKESWKLGLNKSFGLNNKIINAATAKEFIPFELRPNNGTTSRIVVIKVARTTGAPEPVKIMNENNPNNVRKVRKYTLNLLKRKRNITTINPTCRPETAKT
jgi:hypothetical protein